MTRIIKTLADVSDNYDALFVDLWGCVHNGVTAFPDAVEALRTYRAKGGKVVLVTNSPRARDGVADQLENQFDVPADCYDALATSGDSARSAMFQGAVGTKVWFIGQDYDLPFFQPPSFLENPVAIERVPLEQAEGIVCTGPLDATADPKDMRPYFAVARERGMKMLCANPDIVVDRGETREWCAGALAQFYEEIGGESLYFGKPHPPIYDLARRHLTSLGTHVPDTRILCIGDGILTDIAGAMGEDIDSLFITGGLAAAQTKTSDQPHPDALSAYLETEMTSPTFAIGFLR